MVVCSLQFAAFVVCSLQFARLEFWAGSHNWKPEHKVQMELQKFKLVDLEVRHKSGSGKPGHISKLIGKNIQIKINQLDI